MLVNGPNTKKTLSEGTRKAYTTGLKKLSDHLLVTPNVTASNGCIIPN